MDKEGGISMISSKKLTSENPSNVFVNDGFVNDLEDKKHQQQGGDVNCKNSPALNNAREDDGGGGAYYKTRKDGGEETDSYNNLKKDGAASNVDFTLPAMGKGRERSKSILSDGPYRGMGKEELLRYSSRPLWRNLRYACMSIILTGWLALLITVVALVLTYPHCRDAQRKDWWQKTVIYRIYVRSFSDSGRDGVGDIKGIINKLDYLQETGVGTISLSPIYKLADNAPGDTHVTNHLEIDPVFGTMEDFRNLVNHTHSRGMYLVMDFIPNHTSDKHPWFEESKSNDDPSKNVYRSYYVWKKGAGSNQIKPPNSWSSVYNCSAWTLDTATNSFYLHQFLPSQPELNLRSEKVRIKLEHILKFWLDTGVDGFYIRDSDYLFEDYDFRDDILEDNTTELDPPTCKLKSFPYDAYNHTYTKGLTEVFDMLARWRAYLDHYSNHTASNYKILLADVNAPYDHVMKYYGLFNRDGVDFPLNKFSLEIQGGKGVASMVDMWLSKMPPGRWANWMGGDDRSERLTDRLGPEMAQPYLILTMLLPGTPYLYYGDEIGMHESVINTSQSNGNRAMSMRGPMLWNNQTHAGFCPKYCQNPWIAPYKGYKTKNINVEAQQRDPYSMWHLFRNLTELRRENPSFEYGDYVKSLQDDQVFSFVREFDGEKGFLVALNFGGEKVRRHFTGTHDTIPGGGTIEVVTGKTSRRPGNSVGLDPLTLEPKQGIVVSWDYKAKEI